MHPTTDREPAKGDPPASVEALQERLVGVRLPLGSYHIATHEAWLAADATLVTPHPEIAHPLFAYIAGICGMGWDLEHLFARMDSSAQDGPMFGELSVEQQRPLHIGETLAVEGEVTEVVRKQGSAGEFDLMTLTLSLSGADGALAATVMNRFVFPRWRSPFGG